MPRKILKHIREVGKMGNVHEVTSGMAGRWHEKHFSNEAPITLEMGCAHGDYTLALAERFPDQNFIGLDKKGGRLWSAARKALDQDLKNAAFVRGMAEKLEECFAEDEIDTIWITFPDPFSKPSKANKRLLSPKFLEIYRRILKPGGTIHFKTDNLPLFEYCLQFVEAERCLVKEVIRDLHAQKQIDDILKITTFYERKFMAEGRPIYYLEVSLI